MKKVQQYIVWILIVILPLLFTGVTLDPDIYLRFIGLSICLLILAVYFLINVKTVKAGADSLFFVYLAYVVCTFISLFFARNIANGIFDWLKILLGFLLFFLFTALINREKLQNEIMKAFTVLCFILSIAGLINLLLILVQGNLIIPLSTYQVSPFYGHRNLFCQMLFFSFPFTLITSVYDKKTWWRLLGVLSLIMSVFVMIVLSNRATWIALAGGSASLVIFNIIYFKKFRKELTGNIFRRKLFYLVPLIIILFSTLFYLKYADVGSLEKHTEGIVEFDQGSTKDRLELWSRTIQLIKEKPLFGHGLSDWKIEMLKYGNQGLVSEDNNTFYQRPHNDFLWIMSETGIIGILLYVAVFIIALVYIVRIMRNCRTYEDFLFYNLILIVFIGLFVYSFFSFPKERIETLIVTSIMLGLIANKNQEIKNGPYLSHPLLRFILLIVIVLLPLSMYVAGSRFTSDIHMKKALIAKDRKNYSVIIKEINKADSYFYPDDPFSTPLYWYRGSAYFNQSNTDKACKDFEAAYAINPYHIHVLNNLASTYELKGEHDNAITFYKKAVAIAPNFEEAWLNICAVYFNLKQTDSAYQALTHIDSQTKNPKYNKFVSVVLQTKFNAVAHADPALQKWLSLYNSKPEKYLRIHQYSIEHNLKIFSIFTDTLLLKSIFTH